MENLKKNGITFSAFDLFHAGHVQMLADAKEHCDYLIVGLQTDPTIDRPEKNKPSQTVVERYIQLKGCRYVDEIIPYTSERDLEDILKLYSIQVRIIGDEYRNKSFTGKVFCETNNIELYYNERKHRFSSTNLRNEVFENETCKREKSIQKNADSNLIKML
ncbi:adenylyltransferase/cytidyltransferase family protein [Halpernia frigidisoli]|uniref:Glycerol-3-phosphate cytidylyltransferase n=1 Tax=Halpernia frigidisoli TaxID=1125876 RepID=A0A1I3D1M6_9FLAO|nr:adenylyltransferase/cytidyltransferase family protein [Halpernia frigidisoli]SFH80391.1 glycerol-3-phosphate cytidylyltransferase [Halpernia frigidisoli]